MLVEGLVRVLKSYQLESLVLRLYRTLTLQTDWSWWLGVPLHDALACLPRPSPFRLEGVVAGLALPPVMGKRLATFEFPANAALLGHTAHLVEKISEHLKPHANT